MMRERRKVSFLILLGIAAALCLAIPAFAASGDNPSPAKDSRAQIRDLRKQRLKALSKGDYKGAKALAAEIRALDQKERDEKAAKQNQSAGTPEAGKEPKSLFQDDFRKNKTNTSNINSSFGSGSSPENSSGPSPSGLKASGFSTSPSLFDNPKSSGTASTSNVVRAANSGKRSGSY